MRCLITGSSGFIGSAIVQALKKRGHTVIGLDLQPASNLSFTDAYFQGSILDYEVVCQSMQNVDVVIHLAGLTSHRDIVERKYDTLALVLQGTKNVLDAFIQTERTKKFIFSSTGKVYGAIRFLPITEEHPTEPLNILGKSKLIAEQLLNFYACKNKQFVNFRIFNVYGPGQGEQFLIPTIFRQLNNESFLYERTKNTVNITLGDIHAQRDYVYIDDIVAAYVAAVEQVKFPDKYCNLNLSSGHGIAAKTIVEKIEFLLNLSISIDVNVNKIRQDEFAVEFASFQKAQSVLQWAPKITMLKGLEAIIDRQRALLSKQAGVFQERFL